MRETVFAATAAMLAPPFSPYETRCLETLERGLTRRIRALNLFLKDIYHEGRILKDRVVPAEMVYTCRHFQREMRGLDVPPDIYTSAVCTDLVRLRDVRFVVNSSQGGGTKDTWALNE